jgi:YggT family protein
MDVLIQLVHGASLILTVGIIARALLSWVNPSLHNPLVRWVYRITDPILSPIQSLLPAPGGIDFSPLVAIVLIQLIERLLLNLLFNLM